MFEGLIRFIKNQFLSQAEKEYAPVRQEMLVRSQSFKLNYNRWLVQKRQAEVLKNIYTSFTLNKLGITGDVPLHHFRDGNSPHLVIHFIEPMGRDLFPFLQDYFRDRIVRLGYNLYLSERQVVERLGYVEKIERHVLRPFSGSYHPHGLREQLYGNLFVALHYINEKPLYLELLAETITDPHYNSAFSFDELAELLFT